MTPIKPQKPVPTLSVSILGGGDWNLAERSPKKLTMVVFYRGLHCPICAGYLKELDDKLEKFADLGVETIAISCDDAERAEHSRSDWKLDSLTIGYALSIETARAWGLFISNAIADKETAQFTEPGLFLIRPDQTLYYAAINSMPFARPRFDDLLGGLGFVLPKDYPARGEA